MMSWPSKNIFTCPEEHLMAFVAQHFHITCKNEKPSQECEAMPEKPGSERVKEQTKSV